MNANFLWRAVPILVLAAACGRASDPKPTTEKRDVIFSESKDALHGSSYTCDPNTHECVCSEINTFDCWNMEMNECCPDIDMDKVPPIFCGDEVCGYDGKKCKCTQQPDSYLNPAGSCGGRCGNYNPYLTCQCDSACYYYKDCCRDLGAYCASYKVANCSCNFDCGFGTAKPCCNWCWK
jgi:hypothetical protein